MGLYLLSRGPHCESPWTNGQITSGQWRRGSKGTRSYRRRRSKGTLPPSHPLSVSPAPFPLPFILRPRHPTLVVDVAAIRQKSGFAVTHPRRNSLGLPVPLVPLPPPRPSPALLSFSFSFRNFRWKNMAFCFRFCIVNKPGWRPIENLITLTEWYNNIEWHNICHHYKI